MNSLKLLWLLTLITGIATAQDYKPCDSRVTFVDRNMIDKTITVRTLAGSVTDRTGTAVPKDCVALFASDRSRVLRTVEANDNGDFAITKVKSGDYWLVVQDAQRAFCPAATHVKLRRLSRKSKIIVHMEAGGIDQCSYCESR